MLWIGVNVPVTYEGNQLTMQSSTDEVRLVLTHVTGEPDKYGLIEYDAALTGPGVHATARVRALSDRMPGFFDEMAADWRGWDGEREWRSLEGHLRIYSAHNGVALANLVIEVNPGPAYNSNRCFAAGGIDLELGQLDRAASAVSRFFAA